MYGADDRSFSWFATLLRQISSPRIAEVGFYLWGEDVEELSSHDWDEIIAVLDTPRFKPLKRVAFHVWGDECNVGAITRLVSERFASFQERDLLVIDSTPDIACV